MAMPVSKTWFEIQDEKIDAKLNKIIGRLNALQASIDDIETLLSGWRPGRPMQTGPSNPIDEGTS